MRKIYSILVAVIFTVSVLAQAPQKMSYQGVIHNTNNNLVKNQLVGMKISILQESTSGTAVYVETQSPTTNDNGLISIEIGGGVIVSGTFSDINWSSNKYFIKTETDPAGGTNYTITGISQLLSVPYALHANTADYTRLTEKIINVTNIEKANSIGVYSQSEINALGPVSGMLVLNTTTGALNIYNGSNWMIFQYAPHTVGEFWGGGVVCYVDATGQHGLILSMVDLSSSQQWSNVSNVYSNGALSSSDGAANTTGIINQEGHTNSAAKLCDDYINVDYGTGIYSDWFLPAFDQQVSIGYNFNTVQNALANDLNDSTTPLTLSIYWMSYEIFGDIAGAFDYSYRATVSGNKNATYFVRAVRSF
jgi:hypothetical protein